jgi:hypothetical protein
MASQHGVQNRVLGVWGSRAYDWSGEERPRAAGFQIDPTGHQHVLGFPADPDPDSGRGARRGWYREHDRPELEPASRRRLVVAVVAILHGQERHD